MNLSISLNIPTRQIPCAGVLVSVKDRRDEILDGWKPKIYLKKRRGKTILKKACISTVT